MRRHLAVDKAPTQHAPFKSDLMIAALLTLVTADLSLPAFLAWFISLLRVASGSAAQMQLAICIFLYIVMVGYIITIFLIARDQLLPW
nr:unnamed protein product [Callosobruchus chinensis]